MPMLNYLPVLGVSTWSGLTLSQKTGSMKHPWPVVNGTKDPCRKILRNGSFVPYVVVGKCFKDKPVRTGLLVTQLNQSWVGAASASGSFGLFIRTRIGSDRSVRLWCMLPNGCGFNWAAISVPAIDRRYSVINPNGLTSYQE